MKALVIFGVVLCFAIVALSRKPDPVLQPYPTVFTAVYNESDRTTPWQAPRMTSVSLDLPNKRAVASFPGSNGAPESWILIYQPKGGDPKAPASQGYTAFNLNPDYPSQVPYGCYYTTGNLMGLSPFPPHWNVQEDPYNQQVDTWYNLPSDLEYAGQYFIEELGVMSDRWDSVSQCLLEKSGVGQVPCASVMYSQGANPLPLMDIRAFGARKNSFENDRYAVRVYHKFITSVDDSAFDLPNNWQVNCGNADNAFVTDPTALSVFNSGGSDSTLQVKLATPPVAALGNVKVYMVPSPSWYYNCVDCVTFSPTVLTFTQDTWNTSQSWPVKYNSEGCSQFVIRATGGGYDWSYYGTTITTYACVGSNFSGCSAQPTCGNSDRLF